MQFSFKLAWIVRDAETNEKLGDQQQQQHY